MNLKTTPNNNLSAAPDAVLTAREQEIFDKLLSGTTGKEIAQDLKISYDTVSYHRKKIYKKLGVKNILELFTKYKKGDRAIPVPMILEDETGVKSNIHLKILIPTVVFTVVFAVVWLLLQNEKGSFIPSIDPWYAISDSNSSSQISRRDEMINGKMESVFYLSGSLYERGSGSYAGSLGRLFGESLNAARTMKSISFKVMGDGNKYYLKFPTFETIEGDYYFNIFQTEKDRLTNININIPGDLSRYGWSGKDVAFIQNNIMFIQIQPVDPGDFKTKIWDIRFNK